MYLIKWLSLSLVFTLIVSCGVKQSTDELWRTAERNIQERNYKAAVKSLRKLVKAYPDDVLAARAQFRIGDIYMNSTNDIARSLKEFERTIANYPDTEEAVKALFMIGFVNANFLNDYEVARKAYGDFIEMYPNHELVHSVKFELENLGKAIDDLDVLKGMTDAN